jgi:hypothetical protein
MPAVDFAPEPKYVSGNLLPRCRRCREVRNPPTAAGNEMRQLTHLAVLLPASVEAKPDVT